MAKFLVPFKFIAEVEVDDNIVTVGSKNPFISRDIAMKHKAISLGVEHFSKEIEDVLKEGSILDIAHTMAPTMLSDVRQID